MAISGAEFDGYSQVRGFGIYINNGTNPYSYALFFNTDSNPTTGCPVPSVTGSAPPDGNPPAVIIKTVNLPRGITISNRTDNVFYAPPNPKTCVDNSSSNDGITFTLTQTSSNKTADVYVDKYGVIEIR
jgi:hypothetical protein